MYTAKFITLLLAAAVTGVFAVPFPAINEGHLEILRLRASTTVDPNAVTGTTCIDTTANIVFHDQNVAELGICGGIGTSKFALASPSSWDLSVKAITKCGGSPTATTGSSGTALFSLNAVSSGATINVSKGRWEGCVRAARAVCPTGIFGSTCIGGASTGNVAFTLSAQ